MSTKHLLGVTLLVGVAMLLIACSPQDSNASSNPSETMAEVMDDSAIEHARKHADATYVCPMHPQIVRGEPGNCPICGMALEEQEVQSDAGGDFGPPIVTVRPETLQNMGARTTVVERASLSKQIETVGSITYDEDRMGHVHPRAAGWVEKLRVRAEGDAVKRNQVLLELYSPEIVNAQEEYLLALEGISTSGKRREALVRGASRRLRLLDVPDSVVAAINKTRQVQETVPVLAPIDGIITKMGLREGMYVKPDMELFTISDVASVWVQVDVFEHQLDQVRVGNSAEIKIPALPGRVWQGEVDYVYPELDPRTRTLQVRLRFKNSDGILKPNMFVHANIQGTPHPNALTIPLEALIVTGGQERVIKDLGDGRFQPAAVEVGLRAQDRIEILDGLQEGERVVVSGQFLIDSESNLQASFRRMQPLEPKPAPPQAMMQMEN